MMRIALLLFVFSSSFACVRSAADVEPPPEASGLTGQAVAKELDSGDFVGRDDVTIHPLGTSIYGATDDRGFFRIDRVPLGGYDVLLSTAEDPPRARLLSGVRIEVDGQLISVGRVRLGEPGVIEGRVILRRGQRRSSEGGVLVQIVGSALRGFTDPEGGYRIAGVPQGEYELVASFPDFDPGVLGGVSVMPNAGSFALDIELIENLNPPVVQVRGQAVLRGSDTSEDIRVTFTGRAGAATSAVTGPTGEYTVSVPVGVYVVRYERDSFVPVEVPGVAVLDGLVIGLGRTVLVEGDVGDRDGDGVPDDADDDRDNDGIPNVDDAAPDDPTRGIDTDGDGEPDEEDADDDNDGLNDDVELDPSQGGGITDPSNPDTDGDGIDDAEDVCPTVANPDQDPLDCIGGSDSVTCNDGAPQILSLSSTVVRAGGLVTVTGFPIAAPECVGVGEVAAELRFTGPDGSVVSSTPTGPVVPTVFGGVAAELAEYPVPATAVSGPVRLVQPAYAPQGGAPIGVIVDPPGLVVTSVLPAVMRPGGQIAVVGRGFLPRPGVTVTVTFPDGSMQQVAPDRDDRFVVDVPVAATPAAGEIRIALGADVATLPFEIASAAPFFIDIETPLVEPGVSGIRIVGANLEQVTQVLFTGTAVPFDVTAPNAAVIEIPTVPVGVAPGPVTLRWPGGPDVVSRETLSVLTTRRSAVSAQAAIAVFRRNLAGVTDVLTFGSGRVRIHQNNSELTFVTESNVLAPNETPLLVKPRRAHDIAIVGPGNGVTGQTYIVDLARLQIINECGVERPMRTSTIVSFSEDQRYAYASSDFLNSGDQHLLQIDVEQTDGEPCTFFPSTRDVCPNQSFSFRDVVAYRNSTLFALIFVSNRTGIARIRLDPDAPTGLACEEVFTSMSGQIGSQDILWDQVNQLFWTNNRSSLVLTSVSEALTSPLTVQTVLDSSGPYVLSPGGRWMMGPRDIIDVKLGKIAWRRPTAIGGAVDVDPSGQSFVRVEANIIVAYDIVDGPLP